MYVTRHICIYNDLEQYSDQEQEDCTEDIQVHQVFQIPPSAQYLPTHLNKNKLCQRWSSTCIWLNESPSTFHDIVLTIWIHIQLSWSPVK